MEWNYSAECVAGVIVSIILIYAYKGNRVPSLRNRVFELCLANTFCSILFNILSTVMLMYPHRIPVFLVEVVTAIYFACTPLLGLSYFWYTVATSCGENNRWVRKFLLGSTIPYLIYLIMVLGNHWTGALFMIDAQGSYLRGEQINWTYIVFYLYCIASIIMIFVRWKRTARVTRLILFLFPALALLVVLVQWYYPTYILSGSAATCALLIIYLYLQNKRMNMDALTGLATRQEFLNMLAICDKSGEPFTIIVLSINNFRLINDKFGVVTGDYFLKSISEYLQQNVKGAWLCRYGGDQFIIQLSKKNAHRFEEIAMTIARRMRSPWNVGEYNCMLSAVIGIVEYPEVASTVEEVIDGIEAVVAETKRKKVETPYRCLPQTLDGVRRKQKIIELLRNNLRDNSFQVHYQPIWSFKQKRFPLVEALLRMPLDPELGFISPAEFIPLAEDTGLITDITYQTLTKVCIFLNRLRENGVELDCVAINFSVVQFLQEGLADHITEIIEKHGVPYHKIEIEITESVLITNFDVVRSFMTRLSKKGIRFGLDDFGTGNSNVATFLKMPFDTIKLDKSIVWLVMEDPQAAGFMRYLTYAFQAMGRNVVAEGVETSAQNSFVEECGCDLVQGFLYARPVPDDQAERIVRDRLVKASNNAQE